MKITFISYDCLGIKNYKNGKIIMPICSMDESLKFLKLRVIFFTISILTVLDLSTQSYFVKTKNQQLFIADHPYYYIGVNYWCGGIIGNDINGRKRISKELDSVCISRAKVKGVA